MIRVCVIGAGIAGLATIKLMLERRDVFQVVCFDRQRDIGGEWRYTDNTKSENGYRPNAMYQSLRTNTCVTVDTLTGVPFPPGSPHWPSHSQVYKFILNYIERFDLQRHVKLGVTVENVRPIQCSDGKERWLVTVKGDMDEAVQSIQFDSVVVCTGLFQESVLPPVENKELFTGHVIHSCQYREASRYRGQTVLVVGFGPSACDVLTDLDAVAGKIYITGMPGIRLTNKMEITSCKYLKRFTANTVIFENDDELMVDAVVFCTGYVQSYPFLDDTCGMSLQENLLYPAYKTVVNPIHPTLFFNGLTRVDAHFLIVSITAELIRAVLLGAGELPPESEMMATIERDIEECRRNDIPLFSLHRVGGRSTLPFELCAIGKFKAPVEQLMIFRKIHDLMVDNKYGVLRSLEVYMGTDGIVRTRPLSENETKKASKL